MRDRIREYEQKQLEELREAQTRAYRDRKVLWTKINKNLTQPDQPVSSQPEPSAATTTDSLPKPIALPTANQNTATSPGKTSAQPAESDKLATPTSTWKNSRITEKTKNSDSSGISFPPCNSFFDPPLANFTALLIKIGFFPLMMNKMEKTEIITRNYHKRMNLNQLLLNQRLIMKIFMILDQQITKLHPLYLYLFQKYQPNLDHQKNFQKRNHQPTRRELSNRTTILLKLELTLNKNLNY